MFSKLLKKLGTVMLPLNRDFLGGKIEFKPGFLKIFIPFLFISGDFKGTRGKNTSHSCEKCSHDI